MAGKHAGVRPAEPLLQTGSPRIPPLLSAHAQTGQQPVVLDGSATPVALSRAVRQRGELRKFALSWTLSSSRLAESPSVPIQSPSASKTLMDGPF